MLVNLFLGPSHSSGQSLNSAPPRSGVVATRTTGGVKGVKGVGDGGPEGPLQQAAGPGDDGQGDLPPQLLKETHQGSVRHAPRALPVHLQQDVPTPAGHTNTHTHRQTPDAQVLCD